MSASGTYGKRGRVAEHETGIRLVAPTYGRSRIRMHSSKCGDVIVEGQAERLIAHVLAIDPEVVRYRPQPFTVDLVSQRLLTSREQVKEAIARHGLRIGPRMYTPDFSVDWSGPGKSALEIKTDAYAGDSEYQERLIRAGEVLKAHGYELTKVVIPTELSGPLKQNIQVLQQAKRIQRHGITPEALNHLNDLEGQDITLGFACSHLGQPLTFASTLLLTGAVACDLMNFPLRADTPVTLAYGDLAHLRLIARMH